MMRVMNEAERALVEAHMALVETVIQRHITVRPDIPGLEHDDLFQVGSLALCRAAQRYDGRCQFSTFAYTVVKNALLDHCRSTAGKGGRPLSLDAPAGEDTGSLAEQIPDEQSVSGAAEARDLMQALTLAGKRYRGIAGKGVRALEMKVYGYTTREIAELYGVRSNVVAAWVSRARKMLKNDSASAMACSEEV